MCIFVLFTAVKKLENLVIGLTSRVSHLEGGKPVTAPAKSAPAPAKKQEDDDGKEIFL